MSERRSRINEIVLHERPGGELPDDHPLAKWERDVFWAFRKDVIERMVQAGDVKAMHRLRRHDGLIGSDLIQAAEERRALRGRVLTYRDLGDGKFFHVCIHPRRHEGTLKELTNRLGGDFGFGPG